MATSRNRGWLSRKFFRQKTNRRTTPNGCQLGFEALEARQLLSISWTNRGVATGDDNDRFDLVFGPLAVQARGVVDAAIDFWERSINSFNYGDGGNDVYEMKVQMNEFPLVAGSGLGANGGFNDTRNDKPSKGSMGVGWLLGVTPGSNSAAGYFLDPTPYESSEFQGTWQNGFTRQNTGNLGGADLFTMVLHELGHAMGLGSTTQTSAHSLDTEYVDNVNTPASNPVSTLWLFDNGSLWTEWDSGGAGGSAANFAGPQHFAPLGTSAVRLGVTYSGAVALMNASFTSRSIISNIEMDAARLAYGYTVTPPSTYGTTYGQLDANGTLRIDTSSLGNSADAITLSVSGSVLSLTLDTGAPVAGIDPTGSFTSIFAASSVFRVEIDAGGGADVITIGGLGAAPITLRGGNGNDSLIINGATGNNTLGGASYAGGSHNITSYSSIENVTLNGTAGNENFNVSRSTLIGPDSVVVNGFDGTDNVVLGSGDLQFSAPYGYFLFNGGGGSNDGITLNNATQNTLNWQYGVYSTYSDAFAAGYYLQANYAGVENVTIQGSLGRDQFIPGTESGITVNLFGNDGDDNFIVGGGNVGAANYVATLLGGTGNDTLVLDDSLYAGAADWAITDEAIQRNVPGLAQVFSYVGFEGMGIKTGTGGSGTNDITTFGAIPVSITVTGGVGTDNFFLNNFANEAAGGPFGSEQLQSTFDGGGGFNSMIIDDSGRGALTYNMYPTRLEINEVLADDGEFSFFGISGMSVTASDSQTTLNVYGTPADIVPGNQTTVLLGGGNDVVNVFPHDAEGNRTITTNIGIVGESGTETLTIQDTASADPTDYSFSNPFGSGTQNIFGLGTGGLGTATIENLVVNAGTGADTFDVNQFTSGAGLTLNAGGGDDTLNFGNGSLAANITNMAAFAFNGQGDFDRFNLHNTTDIGNWTYTRNIASIQAIRAGYGGLFLNESAIEEMTVDAGPGGSPDGFRVDVDGPGGDAFLASGNSSGTHTILNGAGGQDILQAGTVGGLTSSVQGPITFDAGTPSPLHGGTVNVSSAAHGDAKTAHMTDSTLGAHPDDNLFGAGGSLEFFNITNLNLTLGSGPDTVYGQPLADATVQIVGNNPTTLPGDTLNLDLANAVNYVITPTSATAGNVTSDNLQTLTYSGFESGPNIDDVPDVPIFVVDTLDDENDGDYSEGDLSLREAVRFANFTSEIDSIAFSAALSGGAIVLTLGELRILRSVPIIGLGALLLTIDASGNDPTPAVN
ncbi:MAG: CSLREA domain-containing protein, partial [Pirellulales bacterium]